MTPKEKYEARKSERKEREAKFDFKRSEEDIRDAEMHDMLDRFVTAFETIALAAEAFSKGNSK